MAPGGHPWSLTWLSSATLAINAFPYYEPVSGAIECAQQHTGAVLYVSCIVRPSVHAMQMQELPD